MPVMSPPANLTAEQRQRAVAQVAERKAKKEKAKPRVPLMPGETTNGPASNPFAARK
jgi:hypothetical protein